MYLFTCFFIFF